MTARLHTILLIEDNGDDVALIRRAFKKCNIINPLQVLSDGDRVVDYLAGHGAYADRDRYPLPVLIVLDLKLPKKSGLEVLEWVRGASLIKRIPVVILTSSRESRDLNTAYDPGVNSYLVKPVNFDDLQKVVARLHVYWILTNVPSDMGRA
jgi:CheY-like chemotaxis protein